MERQVVRRVIEVKVRPNARESRLEALEDGSWQALIKAPPVDGKANAELIALIARQFGVPRVAVSIRAGAGARCKRVAIEES